MMMSLLRAVAHPYHTDRDLWGIQYGGPACVSLDLYRQPDPDS